MDSIAGTAIEMGILQYVATSRLRHGIATCLIGGLVLASLTVVCYRLRFNVATVALLYVIVVVLFSRTGNFVSSIVVSIIATLSLAYVAPPAYSFRVDDPLDDVAIVAFLVTSLVIASLVSKLRKATEEALSSVNRRLIESEEMERARIARELHDDIGQRLALLTNELEQLQHDPPTLAEVRSRVGGLQKQSSQLATDINSLSHELHSSKLEYLGLAAAMRNFCAEFGQQRKLKIDFKSRDLPALPPNISLSLFRVLQQALQNAAMHSGARASEVELFGVADAVHLTVRDSGLGFDPEAAMKGTGLGLISMRDRMKLVNGTLSIHSQAHNGTTIHASAPLSAGSYSMPTDASRR